METSRAPGGRRILKDLLLGACLGAIGAALVWQFYPGFWKESPDAALELGLQRRQALQDAAQQQAGRAALAAAVQPKAEPSACDLQPLIPANGAHDGQASVAHPFPGGAHAKAKVFLRAAEAAAAQGRLRDTEVALLAACRESDEASARPTVPLARVLGMLGERYAAAARGDHPPMLREQLHARARDVLTLSAQAYSTALGPNASRSRHARQRLAVLDQDIMAAADAPQPGETRADDEVSPVRRGSTTAQAARRTADTEPSRDRVDVRSDPEVAQLASDLARLSAQAETVTEDPAGFRRRAEAARARRDRCQDAACLREWYGKRRRELLAEF